MLRDMTRKFFAQRCPRTEIRDLLGDERGYDPSMWTSMAELGLVGIITSEEFGGADGNFVDLCIVMEEIGTALVPSPFFATCVQSAPLVERFGHPGLKETFLSSCAAGDLISSLACLSENWGHGFSALGFRARPEKEKYILSGCASYVPFATASDRLVCAALHEDAEDAGRITLFVVDPRAEGCQMSLQPSISADRLYEVRLHSYPSSRDQIIGDVGQGWVYMETQNPQVVTAKCAEMVGVFQQMLKLTVDHVNERMQFGRPLGAFQAIQHHCAEMAIGLETSRHAAYYAAWKISEGLEAQKEAAMAKAWCNDQVTGYVRRAHQVHGAIGFTEEYDLQLCTKRAKACQLMLGDVDHYREKVAKYMDL